MSRNQSKPKRPPVWSRLQALMVAFGVSIAALVFVAPSASAAAADGWNVGCFENGDVSVQVVQTNLVPGSSVYLVVTTDNGVTAGTTATVDDTGMASPFVTMQSSYVSSGDYLLTNPDGSVISSGRFGDGTSCPRPVPAPTLSLSANAATVTVGQSVTLNWTAGNADTLVASGAWSGNKSVTGGSEVVTPSAVGTLVFTLTASNASGTPTVQSVTVTVNPAQPPPPPPCPAPTLTFTVSANTITVGDKLTVRWSAPGAKSLTASLGRLTGPLPLSGSLVIRPPVGTHTVSLTATNSCGESTTVNNTVTVNKKSAPSRDKDMHQSRGPRR